MREEVYMVAAFATVTDAPMEFDDGSERVTGSLYVSPVGKRFVIETISFMASVPTDQRVVEVSCVAHGGASKKGPGSGMGIAFVPIHYGGPISGFYRVHHRYQDELVTVPMNSFHGTMAVRLYADSVVELTLRRSGTKGHGGATVFLSGYLEDLPPTPVV
jgi:hypothetical protein